MSTSVARVGVIVCSLIAWSAVPFVGLIGTAGFGSGVTELSAREADTLFGAQCAGCANLRQVQCWPATQCNYNIPDTCTGQPSPCGSRTCPGACAVTGYPDKAESGYQAWIADCVCNQQPTVKTCVFDFGAGSCQCVGPDMIGNCNIGPTYQQLCGNRWGRSFERIP